MDKKLKGYVLSKEIAKKKLTVANIRDLCKKGKTGEIKGFKGKDKEFNAKLKIDNGKVGFEFQIKKLKIEIKKNKKAFIEAAK